MTIALKHASPPNRWISPRPTRDPRKDGPLLPMQQPRRSLFDWLRGKA